VTTTTSASSLITTRRRVTVLLFTFAAGSVDAIVYLRGHVFTANMTGNSVLLGLYIGEGRGPAAASSLVALASFIVGVLLGALLAGEGGDRVKTFTAVRREVFVEAAILAAFTATCFAPRSTSVGSSLLLIISTSGVAMGMQSAAVKRLSLPGIATTYITGTITSLFSGLVHYLRIQNPGGTPGSGVQTGVASAHAPAHAAHGSPSMRHSLSLQAQVFLSYTVAALVSAALHTRWPSAVALLPVMAITGIGVYMLFAKPATRIAAVPPRQDVSA
jgi:uncharacterized membrane protein YoaK (UPF0700 family)